jgi:putative SOS response-associated peptidase YedK
MCGRFTVKATWAELVALYRLTMDAPPHNLRPHYNVCPTDPVDLVRAEEGQTRARFDALGPDPRVGGAKPSKTRRWRRSTLGQRRSTFVTRALPHSDVRLLRMAGAERQTAVVFHCARWLTTSHSGRTLGRVERPRDWRAAEILHDDHHRAQRLRCGNSRPDAGFLTEQQFAPRERTEYLKPVPNDYLQPGQHEGSKAEADDATLIEPVELATA